MDNPIDTLKFEWTDRARDRVVPVRVYYPKTSDAPCPVIIFSHGLGGTRDGYGYLGRYWASHGYAVFHLQHRGSDAEIWQNAPPAEVTNALRRAAMQPGNAALRVMDVKFAIDQLAPFNQASGPLQGKLDLDRIGVAGHSFGAMTSLAIAGQTYVNARGVRIASPDPRVRAVIAMSAPVPKDTNVWNTAYSSIRIPCFHMTGTQDISPVGETIIAHRRVPFDYTANAESYLLDFQDGDHMVFAGMRRNAARAGRDGRIQHLIAISSTAFWDAYLKAVPSAKSWLVNGGFAAELDDYGTLEIKAIRND